MTQLAHLSVSIDARFANDRDTRTQTRSKLTRTVQINGQIAQVAVVDANDVGLERNRALQFLFVTHFGQHAHIQTVRHGCELAILFVIENGQHQQAGVSLIKTCQPDLVRVDNEVFAQNRLRRDLADNRQKIKTALEIFFIRQHRNGRCVMFVDLSDTRRVKIVADHAFRRRGFFALQNKSGASALQGVIKTAAARHNIILKTGQRLLFFAGFNPDSLIGNDFR
ncbi:hypothetical protein D3C80_954060 [compost metagenome]